MLNSFFSGLYSGSTDSITIDLFLILTGAALLLGALSAFVYARKNDCSRGFAAALATLPAVVSTVILMVSGSIGAGVAVAGTFSLVRFRSAPGSAKEIAAVFTAMAIGLACGMGCPGLAALFTAVMCLAEFVYARLDLTGRSGDQSRLLQITVPESLEYASAFDEVFEQYVSECELLRVKTTGLGSLNKLTYRIRLKKSGTEKALIDALRCRNGNLEINLSIRMQEAAEL